jgi:hypothetical protein
MGILYEKTRLSSSPPSNSKNPDNSSPSPSTSKSNLTKSSLNGCKYALTTLFHHISSLYLSSLLLILRHSRKKHTVHAQHSPDTAPKLPVPHDSSQVILEALTFFNGRRDIWKTDEEMAVFTQGRDFSVLSSWTNVDLCSVVTVGRNLKRTVGS